MTWLKFSHAQLTKRQRAKIAGVDKTVDLDKQTPGFPLRSACSSASSPRVRSSTASPSPASNRPYASGILLPSLLHCFSSIFFSFLSHLLASFLNLFLWILC